MVGTMPVILGVGATVFTKERLDRVGWLALIGSTAGVALIVLGGTRSTSKQGPSLLGDMLIVCALVISLGWILLNKHLMEKHSPTLVTAYGVLSGTVMMAAYVLVVSGPPPIHGVSVKAWVALAASGVLCTACTTMLWNWGMHRVPASRAAVFLNIEPMLGSYLGVQLLGDRLGPFAWAGGGLILAAAVTLTTRPAQVMAEGLLD
jgi:drug/metabolite transporter (DMT)-like permease